MVQVAETGHAWLGSLLCSGELGLALSPLLLPLFGQLERRLAVAVEACGLRCVNPSFLAEEGHLNFSQLTLFGEHACSSPVARIVSPSFFNVAWRQDDDGVEGSVLTFCFVHIGRLRFLGHPSFCHALERNLLRTTRTIVKSEESDKFGREASLQGGV